MLKKLAVLFWEMFRIALFVIGGGYAIIAVADEVFSKKLKWTEEGELIGMLPIYQMIPGIMAGNNAVYVGRKVAGTLGSVVALVAVALPSLVIFTLVSMGFDFIPLGNRWLDAAFLGLRSALTGIILVMTVRAWRKSVVGVFGWVVAAVATVALFLPGVSAVAVILTAVAFGLVEAGTRTALERRGGKFRSSLLAPLIFLKYGLVAIGGGYVLVPVYIQDFVGEGAKQLQLSTDQFANLMALTQITPGPIGVNAATYFGCRMGGVAGAAIATACLLLPGFVMMSLALVSLDKFKENRFLKSVMAWVRPVTVAMMISAVWSFAGMSIWTAGDGGVSFSWRGGVIAALAVAAMVSRRISIMLIIFASAALSTLLSALV